MDLTKTRHLGKFKGIRVQLPKRFLILSNNSYQYSFFMVALMRGVPKNLEGRVPSEKPKIEIMLCQVILEVLKKNT